ncbi:hypothetical protein T12_1927 [Trichinella patagoniensis]|uniref:Uncharacterized protein n=1 Tax=Trichinella patagoniensis TaxID=990121 RepID=A0A0V0Z484_9BILA|nr:hypothetical protein T12_1927 [Trichinella patagoniensis]
MAGLFNVQCALHDLNCHAHARYLFECLKESTTILCQLKGTQGENIDSSAGKINETNPLAH